jgi:DNA repair protein RecO (recombination protein O)
VERFVEEALVLSSLDYGEADKVVALFTKQRGRLSAFASGARKSKRRFAGALDSGTLLTVSLVERSGNMFRFDGAEIQKTFHKTREDLSLISRSLYCLELVRELTRELESHPDLFQLLLNYLVALEAKKAGPTSLIQFELQVLDLTGFRPQLANCVLCESPERHKFDPAHGGMVCRLCEGRAPQAVLVPAEVVDALSRLQQGERTKFDSTVRATCRQVLNIFIAHQLGRKLKAVDFMEQVGVD